MPFHHCGLDNLYLDASAITIGTFDGVHLGHRHVINQLKNFAATQSIPVVVITFFPHPIIVLRDIKEPYYLTLPDERASVLFDLGVDHVITIPFTLALSNLTSFEFMDWVSKHIHPKYLVVGEDFALGKDRKGGSEALREIGRTLGYELEIVSFMGDDQDRVSSSRIRNQLKEGRIENVAALLGRPYTIPVQISIGSNDPQKNEMLVLKLTCDPMQLLPGKGLYEAELDLAPGFRFPVFIHPSENMNRSEMTGLFPMKIGSLVSDTASAKLTFFPRYNNFPAEILSLAKFFPIITEINTAINGE